MLSAFLLYVRILSIFLLSPQEKLADTAALDTLFNSDSSVYQNQDSLRFFKDNVSKATFLLDKGQLFETESKVFYPFPLSFHTPGNDNIQVLILSEGKLRSMNRVNELRFAILTMALILVVWAKFRSSLSIKDFFLAPFLTESTISKVQAKTTKRPLDLAFFLTAALLCQWLLETHQFPSQPYLFIFLGLLSLYLGKSAFNLLVMSFAPKKEILIGYLSKVFQINRAFGIAMLPILFFLFFSYSEAEFVVSKAIYALLTMLIVIRISVGFKLTSGLLKNKFHFLLYFCGTEVLPTLILAKILLNE